MKSPREVQDTYRANAYILSVFLVLVPLSVASISNYQAGAHALALVELVVMLIFVLTLPFAFRRKNLELLSNVIAHTLGIAMLFGITNIGSSDPTPYAAYIIVLISCALLTFNIYSFIVYAFISYISFFFAYFLGFIDLSVVSSIKFQAIYLALAVLIILHKMYLDIQHRKLFSLAEESKERVDEAEKEVKESSTEIAAREKQNQQLAEQAQQLEEQKQELAKMNELMIGRELKMVELKKEIDKLNKNR